MLSTVPFFGTALLVCVLFAALYTFSVSVSAGKNGQVATLQAARLGAYGTVALIGCAVLCLLYAFLTHDFRLRYVSHYSDRSMPLGYLFTALWGGQDGSLLWWLFLLSLYIGACVKWMGLRYRQLQPYVLATLMVVVGFFCVLMMYAANPFSRNLSGAPIDGEGLNPLLQNYWMVIHPPCLYIGFVGCTIPFAFGVAALITGRLDQEWVTATRKWMLFTWLFLVIGNTLGMVWAYEELGWGGYWAWDPVENAAFMPLLCATAYVHSIMIQERRGMFKVWNVFLICLTFFMTIFGTFLTRSGAIASVHAFAQSSIGTYFIWFLAFTFVTSFSLILYRLPELRDYTPTPRLRIAALTAGWFVVATFAAVIFVSRPSGAMSAIPTLMLIAVDTFLVFGAIVFAIMGLYRLVAGEQLHMSKRPLLRSFASREFTFILNNWGLLVLMVFVLVSTTFPMLTEALANTKVSVGPPFYNAIFPLIALVVYALMGIGTLFGWTKTSNTSLQRAFFFPALAAIVTVVAHFALGPRFGYPPVVWSPALYDTPFGLALRFIGAHTPWICIALSGFNLAIIAQEFFWLLRARLKSGKANLYWVVLVPIGYVLLAALVKRFVPSSATLVSRIGLGALVFVVLPAVLYWFSQLPAPSRRRYGGYICHLGIVLAFIGFTGKAWSIDHELTMKPGQEVDFFTETSRVGLFKNEAYRGDSYTLKYKGVRRETDPNKMQILTDVTVTRNGEHFADLSPGKNIYQKMPESPTTEVAIARSASADFYIALGNVNPETKVASFQLHLNRLVDWIWGGVLVMIFGAIISLWPQLQKNESRAWAFARTAAAVGASVMITLVFASAPSSAFAQAAASQHAGTVHIENATERALFSGLRCMCGSCARELLSSCACDTASETRDSLREKLANGMTAKQITLEYEQRFGVAALAVPPSTGAFRAIYMVPLAVAFGSALGLGIWLRRSRRASAKRIQGDTAANREAYDARIDEELRHLDD